MRLRLTQPPAARSSLLRALSMRISHRSRPPHVHDAVQNVPAPQQLPPDAAAEEPAAAAAPLPPAAAAMAVAAAPAETDLAVAAAAAMTAALSAGPSKKRRAVRVLACVHFVVQSWSLLIAYLRCAAAATHQCSLLHLVLLPGSWGMAMTST